MAFDARSRSGQYSEYNERDTNEALDRRNEMEINMIRARNAERNEGEYVTPTGAVFLTSTGGTASVKMVFTLLTAVLAFHV